MSKVLIVAEHDGKQLATSTYKCVTCATRLPSASIDVAVLADGGAPVAEQAAAITGVARVVHIDAPHNAQALATVYAPQVAELAKDYTHVLGPSTTFGKDVMPRIAALLEAAQISDIMAIEGEHRFRRPVYAGNAILTVEIDASRPVVGTVRTASFPAAESGGAALVERRTVSAAIPSYARFVSLTATAGDRPDLQSALRVVSGGRALGSAENFQLLYDLADALGAAVGASRAAVDSGYASNELQVGQTGRIIAPELYVAVGISGAIQHVTGIKDAKTIVAINRDAEAAIFEVADFGLVGDLFTVIPELRRALGK